MYLRKEAALNISVFLKLLQEEIDNKKQLGLQRKETITGNNAH